MTSLADFTTLHIGGTPHTFVQATDESQIIDSVVEADMKHDDILILGGGSNVIIADSFHGNVLHISNRGIENDSSVCAGAWVTVQAGTSLDELVATAVHNGWTGLEGLSGIPGTVGATPIQNVGAYGQQVSDTIAQVRAWNRETQQVDVLFAADCEFSYRDSIFKRNPKRWVVLSVTFQLKLGDQSAPIEFDELAKKLEIEKGQRASTLEVREAVLALRNGKGMVVNHEDHDTWSVGSFFLNPRTDSVPEGAPAWEQPDGRFKVSAAWLIENTGFGKGFGLNDRATLSNKHTLAITNRGNATAADILELASFIQTGVKAKYGITLELEPRLVQ